MQHRPEMIDIQSYSEWPPFAWRYENDDGKRRQLIPGEARELI